MAASASPRTFKITPCAMETLRTLYELIKMHCENVAASSPDLSAHRANLIQTHLYRIVQTFRPEVMRNAQSCSDIARILRVAIEQTAGSTEQARNFQRIMIKLRTMCHLEKLHFVNSTRTLSF